MPTIEHYDVVIIGSGVSGLKAAHILKHEHKIDNIKIFEARDRIGGRLKVSEPGYHNHGYDMGASWHHDILINNMFHEESQRKDGPYRPYVIEDDSFSIIDYESDKSLDLDKNINIMPIFNELISYLSHVNSIGQDASYKQAVFNYINKMKSFLTEEQQINILSLSRYTELWNGDSWSLMSGMEPVGGHFGRNALVDQFGLYVNKFVDDGLKECVELSTEVSNINIVADATNNKKIAEIVTSDGRTVTADYVICSIPLSLLKKSSENSKQQGSIIFNPPIRESLTNALSHISFGSLGKFFFEFDSIKWDLTQSRTIILDHKFPEIIEAIKQFDSDQNLTIEQFELMEKLSTEKDFNEIKCDEYPYFVLNVAKSFNIPTILLLTQEPLTSSLELKSQKELFDFFKPALIRILKSYNCDKLLSFEPDNSKSIPSTEIHLKNIVHSTWTSDPYALGAYTSVRAGDAFDPFIEESLKGHQEIVRFVGEAFIEEGNGCVWGAEQTAIREVKKIIEHDCEIKLKTSHI
ncbi:hypothetical protein QEN19_002638 [Hanseniaspora menglaensis]